MSIPAEVARYRLAFLDAAHAAETIASDMAQEGHDTLYAERCRELAQQMREFAGHTANAPSFKPAAAPKGSALARLLPKVWSR